jgi:hypothetical protein
MAETTADVRRDIELTRERMSSTLAQLERKLNLGEVVKEHPWPALGLAFGAGLLLSGSRADVKAAAATVTATKGAGSKLGTALDDIVSNLMQAVGEAMQGHVDGMLNEVKQALGVPQQGDARRQGFASYGGQQNGPTPTLSNGDGSGWSPDASVSRAD